MTKKDLLKTKSKGKNTWLKISIILLGYFVIFGLGFSLGLNYAQNLYFKTNSLKGFKIKNKEDDFHDNISFYYKLNGHENEATVTSNKFNNSKDLPENLPTITNNKENKNGILEHEIKSRNQESLDDKKITNEPYLKYTIQVYSFKSEKISKKVVNELNKKGYPAYISSIKLGENDIFYRVRVGHFNDRANAMKILDNIHKNENKDAFITRD